MAVHIALLRAVNVGGTGALAMANLRRLCEAAGFTDVRTYIASGNVIFGSPLPQSAIKAALEERLRAHAGTPIGVLVRSAADIAAVVAGNPFPAADPSRTVAIFLDAAPAPDALTAVTGRADEELRLGAREIYVHYRDGMARSRLRIAAARDGTARNMNTVARLAALAAGTA